ncbi:MAG: hypothetical protein L0I06_04730, partial [Acidipropionibacterium jensenii]|nr:hypothetical protein [Acidipropionibacterium jensenii]
LDLRRLLVQLRDVGLQMAGGVEVYGGVSGVVTLEDAVEEIVGEVADEHDQLRAGIRSQPDGSFLVPGRLRPDELRDRTGVKVPDDGPYETLAGLVMTLLGRVPSIGDTARTEDGTTLTVTRMVRRRVSQLRITPAPKPEDEEES